MHVRTQGTIRMPSNLALSVFYNQLRYCVHCNSRNFSSGNIICPVSVRVFTDLLLFSLRFLPAVLTQS